MAKRLSPKVARQRISAGERAAKAVELYTQGWSFRRIAEELDFAGPSGAHKAVQKAIKDIPSPKVTEVRVELSERARMYAERASQMHDVLRKKWAKGDLDAMSEARAIDAEGRKRDEHVARLHGAYAPATSVHLNAEAPKDVRRQLLDRLARLTESDGESEGPQPLQ